MIQAYYNERDPKAAAWLRELINQGLIAPGVVDERSIEDVLPSELMGYTQCHFFAGIGVWSYALRQAGWPDDRPVWTGSCPCQPFSSAGKRGGVDDERHLWPAWFWLISQCRPDVVYGEQVGGKGGREWFRLVSSDLAGIGYRGNVKELPACGFGAPHIRQRLFFVADADGEQEHAAAARGLYADAGERGILGNANDTGSQGWGLLTADSSGDSADQCAVRQAGPTNGFWRDAEWLYCRDGKYRAVEPGTFPLAHGAAARVGRLRGYGNAIVAPVAEAFIRSYLDHDADIKLVQATLGHAGLDVS